MWLSTNTHNKTQFNNNLNRNQTHALQWQLDHACTCTYANIITYHTLRTYIWPKRQTHKSNNALLTVSNTHTSSHIHYHYYNTNIQHTTSHYADPHVLHV